MKKGDTASDHEMSELYDLPIRGKPRTLERTMVDSRFVDGSRGGRAMGSFGDFLRILYCWT